MTPNELNDFIEEIEGRYGHSRPWERIDRFADEFDELDTTEVWAALFDYLAKDNTNYPPMPMFIQQDARHRMREKAKAAQWALPAETDTSPALGRWKTMDEWRDEFRRLNDGMTPTQALAKIVGDVAETWGDWDRDPNQPDTGFSYDDIVWPEGTGDEPPRQWPGRPHQNDCDHPRRGVLDETVGENGTKSTLEICVVCLQETWFPETAY